MQRSNGHLRLGQADRLTQAGQHQASNCPACLAAQVQRVHRVQNHAESSTLCLMPAPTNVFWRGFPLIEYTTCTFSTIYRSRLFFLCLIYLKFIVLFFSLLEAKSLIQNSFLCFFSFTHCREYLNLIVLEMSNTTVVFQNESSKKKPSKTKEGKHFFVCLCKILLRL